MKIGKSLNPTQIRRSLKKILSTIRYKPLQRQPLWSNLPEYAQITPARQNSRKPLWKKVRPAHFSDRHRKGFWRGRGEAVQITSTLATPTQHTENIKKKLASKCLMFFLGSFWVFSFYT